MNAGFAYRDVIGRDAAGQTVLDFLAGRYRHSSEATWSARIAAGEVSLGGVPAAARDRLAQGAVLVWQRPPWQEPDVPLAFAVLHRDAHLLAVAKPRGLPSVPGGGFLTHTLLHLVRESFPRATPLHRLGRGTSGIVLYALTPAARRALSAAFRRRSVEKVYRALVQGRPAEEAFSIEAPIGLSPHPRLGDVHAAARDGKAALSHVRVLERGRSESIVEVRIPTGRPHQIRIHLAFAGHPLVGDVLYGPGGRPLPEPGLPGDLGYWLHAGRLELDHPFTGRRLALECAPPRPLCRRDAVGGVEGTRCQAAASASSSDLAAGSSAARWVRATST